MVRFGSIDCRRTIARLYLGPMRHPDLHGKPSSDAIASVLDGYVVENQAGFLIRRVHQRHMAIFHAGMGGARLTPTQFTALVKTAEIGRVTQNQLGWLAAMDPATIQGVVRRLADRRLVTRTADPVDRRTTVLTATQSGPDLAARAVVAARGITEADARSADPQ